MSQADDERLEAARRDGRAVLRAAVYTRMSRADMDDQTKVADQERICRELAARKGWDVAGVYPDNNRSAWQRDRKRPGWDAMLADVEAGKVSAIIVYHGDRLIRQPRDLEDLIDLARGKGIRLASPAGERDLDSGDDQFVLSIEAAMARRESANISRRQKARYERDRLAGKVMAQGPGGRRLGYRSDGVTLAPPDRCVVVTRAAESEADVIREMCARTLAGDSAGAIMAGLQERGWRTPAGNRIDRASVRRILSNPRYVGLMPDGETRAAWPAILGREDWEAARAIVAARAARYPSGGQRTAAWLLSGIARCCCGAPMVIAHVSSRGYRTRVYACRARDSGGCGKVYRGQEHLDAHVSAYVAARLGDDRNPAARRPADPGRAAEWRALEAQRAEVDALLDDYRASAGRTAKLMRQLDQIDARMTQLRELAGASARDRLLRQYQGITLPEFRALPLDVRRALARATASVTVLPASRRGPGFRPQDVRLEPAR